MEKRALLIEWNQHTGKRAGNINPKKDRNLICYGWQNMDVDPAIELRLIEDNRDILQYKSVQGITILVGKNQINKAIDDNFSSKINVEDQLVYEEHFKQKLHNGEINIDSLSDNKDKRLKELKDVYKIKGIKEIKLMKV